MAQIPLRTKFLLALQDTTGGDARKTFSRLQRASDGTWMAPCSVWETLARVAECMI